MEKIKDLRLSLKTGTSKTSGNEYFMLKVEGFGVAEMVNLPSDVFESIEKTLQGAPGVVEILP
jgi:hypothetical protein